MRVICLTLICLAMAAAAARAAPPLPVIAGADGVIQMEPAEVDSFTCDFSGRTLTSKGTAVAELRKAKQADASPTSMITAQSSSGSKVSITVAPDTGCATTGCRAGNTYQIVLQPVEGSNKPICNLYLVVEKNYLRGP